jgi:hypothetical protein
MAMTFLLLQPGERLWVPTCHTNRAFAIAAVAPLTALSQPAQTVFPVISTSISVFHQHHHRHHLAAPRSFLRQPPRLPPTPMTAP